MATLMRRFGLAAGALALVLAAPAVAAPAPDAATAPHRALDADLPTDRPIIATVVEINEAAGTVMLSTPHGNVALSVTPELAERLTVGDIVLVRFTDEDDFPSASPRETPAPQERERI
jgi:hypothetical protein